VKRGRIPFAAVAAILAGGIAWLWVPQKPVALWIWSVGLILTAGPVVVDTVREAAHGKFAADLVATLTVTLALILGHPVVGLVIVIMQT